MFWTPSRARRSRCRRSRLVHVPEAVGAAPDVRAGAGTVKTPFEYDALPAAPTEPTSCVCHGLGTEPPEAACRSPHAVVKRLRTPTMFGSRGVAFVRDTTFQ